VHYGTESRQANLVRRRGLLHDRAVGIRRAFGAVEVEEDVATPRLLLPRKPILPLGASSLFSVAKEHNCESRIVSLLLATHISTTKVTGGNQRRLL
jgi:hypothetical protein